MTIRGRTFGLLAAGSLVLGVPLLSTLLTTSGPNDRQASAAALAGEHANESEGPTFYKPPGESPIIGGVVVPAATLRAKLPACGCPELPDNGPMSFSHVETAWTNERGEVAIEFDSEVRLYYVPDTRSEDEYISNEIADMEDPDDPLPGSIVALRETRAAALPKDTEGPSYLSWREGFVHVEMYGHGGQTLPELTVLAESLSYGAAPQP